MRYIINPNQYKLITETSILEGKYTEDYIINIASNYKTPDEFKTANQYAYRQARKNEDLWNKATSHMIKRPQVKRSIEDVYAEALKYDYLKDFYTKSENTYRAAKRLGILDDVTKHMKVLEGLAKRVVYAFEFPDNSVYVGLTHDVKKRERQHQDRGSVSEHFRETNLTPNLVIISDDYIDANDAQKMEACTIESYRSNGWNILNKSKAGSLGSCRVFWTKERVRDLTKNLTTWKEFQYGYKGAYDSAYRNEWLNDEEITGHLKRKKKYSRDSIWDTIKQEQFNDYGEFIKYDKNKLYQAAQERGMIDDIKKYFNPNISDQTMQ
jgi:predicted GIY-YIG superfamily endonuclease